MSGRPLARTALLIALLMVPALAGCFDPFRPHVDPSVVGASPHAWRLDKFSQQDGGLFGPNFIETEYRFEPENRPPLPGLLVVVGIRALQRGDSDEILDRTREIVDETLRAEGVTVDRERERTGERVLRNGASTEWFRLIGTSPSSGGLFTQSEEVRVLGETWYDGRSKTNVVAIALAQTTTQGGVLGQATIEDMSVWRELVGDRAGAIDGAIHDAAFIDHMVSHA